jgi:chromatin remodeling complex protein RSC6
MARAIVRYSFNNTAGKYQAEKARSQVRAALKAEGFKRVGQKQQGTASWEKKAIKTADLGKALAKVFGVVEGLKPGVLDHIWVYCDE